MKAEIFLIAVFMLISNLIFSQDKYIKVTKAPTSIYTINSFSNNPNSFSKLNSRLNLKSFEFVTLNVEDIENNVMAIDFLNIDKKPSEFIYDDYNNYQNNYLLKGFRYKNDPTRWNLHCIENRIQPYFLNKQ
ncbi:hypothetical protein [uncultured Polaribacter sp.]|uniref:hypothetical protein n=1 Tax=uncultured Polaribacter sp. TaxID=174711 RepID=UPI0026347844|nr:hypothetical protein [uncultured Polaribacter sp.]